MGVATAYCRADGRTNESTWFLFFQTQMYCEDLLGTSNGTLCQKGNVFNYQLWKTIDQIPKEAGDIESKWTSIIDVAVQSCFCKVSLLVVAAIPEHGGGHHKQGMLSS